MGARGPAPRPEVLRAMDGNPGKHKVNPGAVSLTIGMPVCPDYLGEYEREVWNRITDNMPSRLYGAGDTAILAAYCVAAGLHRKAVIRIGEEGEVCTGEGGAPYQSPWVTILNRQAALIATLGTRLGLDPAARNNVNIRADAPVSKFAGLVGIQGGRTA